MGIVGWGRSGLRRTGIEIVGWTLVVLGIAALVLPGPGLLMLFAGIAVLSQQYEWARRAVEPMKKKAFEAATTGVRTWPRIVASAAGASWVIAVGIIWGLDPAIPTFELAGYRIGPDLPFAGWVSGLSLIFSGAFALFLLGYSVHRFRPPPSGSAETERRELNVKP